MFTPHARGSTCVLVVCLKLQFVYPACAGIDLLGLEYSAEERGLPRMRGDRPFTLAFDELDWTFTPHARGSTDDAHWDGIHGPVYPACAGIDPLCTDCYEDHYCLPRMRGDRPHTWDISSISTVFTPHARGSTYNHLFFHRTNTVYPACAGIDPDERSHGIR